MKMNQKRTLRLLSLMMAVCMVLAFLPTQAKAVLLMPGDIVIDNRSFPDEGFRRFVKEDKDDNKDGILSWAERANEVDLYMDRPADVDYPIRSLAGIEYFPHLVNLYAGNQEIQWLDLSQNPDILNVYLPGNRLTHVDVTGCPKLEELELPNNSLRKLELYNNPNLVVLKVNGNNLTNLNLDQNRKLPFGTDDVNLSNQILTVDHYADIDLMETPGEFIPVFAYNLSFGGNGGSYSESSGLLTLGAGETDYRASFDYDAAPMWDYGEDAFLKVEVVADGYAPEHRANNDFSAKQEYAVSRIIGLRKPEAGIPLDYSATIQTTGDGTANMQCMEVVQVRYARFHKPLSEDYIPEAGEEFSVGITIRALDGYDLPDKAYKLWWNYIHEPDGMGIGTGSVGRVVQEGSPEITYIYEVTADYPAQDQIIFGDSEEIDVPQIGKTPPTSFNEVKGPGPKPTLRQHDYDLVSMTWKPADETFQPGVAYTVTAELAPKEHYMFDSSNGDLAITLNGESMDVTVESTGLAFASYTFPALPEPVEPPKPPKPAISFTDVKPGQWFAEHVQWAVENGITDGFPDGTFQPGANCTRAQVVTFLWRAAGSPKPATEKNPFSDVKPGWYYDAVLWAVENGITDGFPDGTFQPGANCTRAQVVTFLHRAAAE